MNRRTTLSTAFNSNEALIIRNVEDLQSITKPKLFASKRPIIIELPGLSPAEAEGLSARVNGYRNECGCSMGAKTMATGFFITLSWLLLSYGVFTSQFLWRLPLAFLFALLCAGVGKSIGISLARRRLRFELDQLHLDYNSLT